MAYRTEDEEIGGGENGGRRREDDFLLPALDPFAGYPKTVGPLTVHRTLETLSLRRENAGGLSFEAYVYFGIAMLALTLIGFMGMVAAGQSARGTGNAAALSDAASPSQNHFALLWIVGAVALMIGVPIYVKRAYGKALVFAFDKATGSLTEDGRKIVPLRRIERVDIRETRDTDDRYLYLLQICHTDGHELLIYNGYEEREVIVLADEIAAFLGVRTRFTGVRS